MFLVIIFPFTNLESFKLSGARVFDPEPVLKTKSSSPLQLLALPVVSHTTRSFRGQRARLVHHKVNLASASLPKLQDMSCIGCQPT